MLNYQRVSFDAWQGRARREREQIALELGLSPRCLNNSSTNFRQPSHLANYPLPQSLSIFHCVPKAMAVWQLCVIESKKDQAQKKDTAALSKAIEHYASLRGVKFDKIWQRCFESISRATGYQPCGCEFVPCQVTKAQWSKNLHCKVM